MPFSLENPMPIVVLISGKGTNLQAIMDAIAAKKLPVKIEAVISNQAKAYGLERARLVNIPTHVISNMDFVDREKYDEALQSCIEIYNPKLIVLAGFMRILTAKFVKHFQGKIINIHPSLLPKFPGMNTHQRVLTAGEAVHGVTIHWVTEDLDSGPIIRQEKIIVNADDSATSLEEKIHRLEHQLYPAVLKELAKTL